jgi:gliding motility-associated-like protein
LCHEHIYIPNAFSPNGDNINDYFEIKSEDVVSINYSIFDRWGTRLQNSNAKLTEPGAFKIWDGKLNDEFCLPGVYIYLLEVKFANGAIQNFSGDLNLIR